jgi:sec-independent protein translocase protein TatB
MLDVAWSEILVILLVASIIISPKDMPIIIKSIKKFFTTINNFKNEAKELINDISESVEMDKTQESLIKEGIIFKNNQKYIVDLEGTLQAMYDIEDLKNLSPTVIDNIEQKDKETIH